MKAERMFARESLSVLRFNTGAKLVFDGDMAALYEPGREPVTYEGGVEDIDAVIDSPTALYEIPTEEMDDLAFEEAYEALYGHQ